MPALFTTIETSPRFLQIAASIWSTSFPRETSALTGKARRPLRSISEHTAFAATSSPSDRKLTATAAPALANATAMPRPIPRLAPVTSAIFPAKPVSMLAVNLCGKSLNHNRFGLWIELESWGAFLLDLRWLEKRVETLGSYRD